MRAVATDKRPRNILERVFVADLETRSITLGERAACTYIYTCACTIPTRERVLFISRASYFLAVSLIVFLREQTEVRILDDIWSGEPERRVSRLPRLPVSSRTTLIVWIDDSSTRLLNRIVAAAAPGP